MLSWQHPSVTPEVRARSGVERWAAWIWPDWDPETKRKIYDTVAEPQGPKDWNHSAPSEGKEGKERKKNMKKIEVQWRQCDEVNEINSLMIIVTVVGAES